MKKSLLFALLFVCLLAFTSCGSKDEPQDSNTDKVTEATSPTSVATETPAPTAEETPAPTATEDPTEAPTEVPTEEPTEAPTEEPTPEVTEAPPATDYELVPVDTAALEPVFAAYAKFLEENYVDPSEELDDVLKFGLAYIDEDDVPELLVAYNSYHFAGVDVVKYNAETDSTYVMGDTIGYYGALSYCPFQNRLVTFFYGMGYENILHYTINGNQYDTIGDIMYDDNEMKFYIKGEEVEYEEYDEAYTELAQLSADSISFDYYYAPTYTKDMDIMSVLADMAEAAYNKKVYYPPVSFEVSDINGEWDLFYATIYDSASDATNCSYDLDIATGALYLNLDEYNHFWTHFDDEYYSGDELSYTVINERLVDQNNYADWYIKLQGENDNDEYYATMYSEGNETYVFFRHITLISDTDTKTMDMIMYRFSEEDYAEAGYATISYNEEASNNEDGYIAFTAQRYLWIHPDDTELIEQYGLAPDLDGYDYELYTPEEDSFIIYVPSDSTFQVIDWSNGYFDYSILNTEDFISYLNEYGLDGSLCVEFWYEGEYNGGIISNTFIEDYTG